MVQNRLMQNVGLKSNRLEEFLLERDEILFNYSYDQLTDKFETYLKRVGVEGTLYMLRHIFATNLYYLGVPDKERQVYMRHYSSVLTNDVYTTFDPNLAKMTSLNYIIIYTQNFDTIFDTTFFAKIDFYIKKRLIRVI